jgi:hypothetical protein
MLRPGSAGEPLPDDEWILRLAPVPSEPAWDMQKAHPGAFDLSPADENHAIPHLSVYAERLTHPVHARALMERSARYELVLRLHVGGVRYTRPRPDSTDIPSLDVQWFPKTRLDEHGAEVPDTRTGASGHSGITGLKRPPGIPRSYYK